MNTETHITSAYVRNAMLQRFNPIPFLTPEVLEAQLNNFNVGWPAMAAISWDAIEKRDYTLRGVAAKRKKSVARLKRESLTLDASDEAKAHAEALDEFYDNLRVVNALDENETGGFSLLVRQMMDAAGKYYAVHEIVWKPGETLTAELRFAPLWFFENRTGKLRFLPFVGGAEGVDLEEGGWMVTKGDGLMEACCVCWLFKHLPLKDWLVYSDRFGLPRVVGRTSGNPESDAGKAMVKAVSEFGSGDTGTVIFSDDGTGKIETVDVSKASTNLPFPALIELMDRAMCSLWRGSDLSTMSRPDGMGASLQGDESDLLLEDDAELISETLNLYIDRFVILQRFGTDRPMARSRLIVPKRATDMDLKIDEFLVQRGVQLGKRERAEHYGRPQMADDDEPMAAPQPAPQPGATPDGQPGAWPGGGAKPPGRDFPNEKTGPQGKPGAEMQAAFLSGILADLRKATQADLSPLTERIRELVALPDDQFQAAFSKLIADRDTLAAQILKDPAAAQTFSDALGAALVNGLAEDPTHLNTAKK